MEEFFDYAARGTKDMYRRKKYVAGGMYHVFNRRSDEQPVFLDDVDRLAYVEIMQRLLEPEMFKDARGRSAEPTHGEITLLGYALLSTHYHSVVKQELIDGLTRFMRRVQIAYTKHFNARHGRSGALFDERYQAVPITNDFQAKTAIAYVHANPGEEIGYEWTGHDLYLDPHAVQRPEAWLDARAGLEIYGSLSNYLAWFARAVEARRRKNDK